MQTLTISPARMPAAMMEGMPLSQDKREFNWAKSREILNRLFQGYVNDYGEEAGQKIIATIIDVLGGIRMTIPERMSTNAENNGALLSLYACFCERFDDASGQMIMHKFLVELKNCRISFPDHEDINREERNRKIRGMFNGRNAGELAIIFGLDVRQIRNILYEEE